MITQEIKKTLIRIQAVMLPAFIGGFFGRDFLSRSITSSKLIIGFATYIFINLVAYLVLKMLLAQNTK